MDTPPNIFIKSYLQTLGKAEPYGRAYWDWQNNRGIQPNPRDYGISDRTAQKIRIRLAQG